MSVEGLLSEVSAILGSRLAVKAADQAFFGGKQVYTDVSASTSSSGKGGNDNKKGGDKLQSAIQNAKQIVDKALAGQASAGGSNDKVFAEIASLKKENQSIKDELAQLRKLVEQLSVSGVASKFTFEDASSVLVLGDGNLSFSLAFACMRPHVNITATVLEDESSFIVRYGCEHVIRHLRRLPNVTLRFDVDATRLPEHWHGLFDTIIMNFPHPGGKTNLRRSRLLATGVFRSVRSIMTERARFHLSLANGQAGFSLEDDTWSRSPPSHRKDSWQAIYLAAEEGLTVHDVIPMFPFLFPGYKSSGYLSTGQGFNNWKAAQRIVFCCSRGISYDDLRRTSLLTDRFHLHRPFFTHDVSFLFDCNISDVDKFEVAALRMVEDLVGSMVLHIQELKELRSYCPDPYLPNRIYRLFWQPQSVAIGKKICNGLQEQLRANICHEISSRALPLILT